MRWGGGAAVWHPVGDYACVLAMRVWQRANGNAPSAKRQAQCARAPRRAARMCAPGRAGGEACRRRRGSRRGPPASRACSSCSCSCSWPTTATRARRRAPPPADHLVDEVAVDLEPGEVEPPVGGRAGGRASVGRSYGRPVGRSDDRGGCFCFCNQITLKLSRGCDCVCSSFEQQQQINSNNNNNRTRMLACCAAAHCVYRLPSLLAVARTRRNR